MKKEQQFQVNDKVFAKVKGYPPWPAVILENNGKKYMVKFYGTGELGQIKAEDLFYYSRNKNKFSKPSKRKDFIDSIKEIETAILEAGTDGDPNYGVESSNDSMLNDSSSFVDSDTSLTKKRKRSMSIHKSTEDSSSPVNKAKKGKLTSIRSNEESPVNQQSIVNTVEEPKSVEKKKVADESTEEKPKTTVTTVEPAKEVTKLENDIVYEETAKDKTPVEEIEEIEVPGYDDFVMERELEAFIAYGEYVEKREELYLKMPIEKRKYSKQQVLPLFIGDKCIGIKIHEKWPLKTFENEFENAVYDKQISQKVLQLKNSFRLNLLKESPDLYCQNIKTTENELKCFWEKKLLAIKQEIMENVKAERKLLEIDAKIKSCLNLDKADPKQAIALLEDLLNLDITELMLKKHAHVVDMVRRLKKYVGNLESWNLTDEETDSFKQDAEKVRGSALKLHVKFLKIVGKPQCNEWFWDHFNDITTKFREEIKDFSEMEFYLLFSWPRYRGNFLNNYFIKDISLTIPSEIETNVNESAKV